VTAWPCPSRTVLFAVCLGASAGGLAQDAMRWVSVPEYPASVEIFFAPEYPASAVASRQAGKVVIEGRVDPRTGKLVDVVYRPDVPESAVFVKVVEDVVPSWRFNPPLKGCIPTDEPAAAEVTFRFAGDKPTVALTRGRKGRLVAVASQVYRPLKQEPPKWPVTMQIRGWSAFVYARLDVDNAGKVSQLQTRSYSPDTNREEELEPFAKSAAFALSKWEYAPVPADFEGPRSACFHIHFRLIG
jgi:hypothetical protein